MTAQPPTDGVDRAARNEAAVMHFLDGLHDLTTPDLAAAIEPFDAEAVQATPAPHPVTAPATPTASRLDR